MGQIFTWKLTMKAWWTDVKSCETPWKPSAWTRSTVYWEWLVTVDARDRAGAWWPGSPWLHQPYRWPWAPMPHCCHHHQIGQRGWVDWSSRSRRECSRSWPCVQTNAMVLSFMRLLKWAIMYKPAPYCKLAWQSHCIIVYEYYKVKKARDRFKIKYETKPGVKISLFSWFQLFSATFGYFQLLSLTVKMI